MHTVTSADGTKIAYDKTGEGPVVILIGGALGYRDFSKMRELEELLAQERVTVINYDRRGRGDSTEATPFSHDTAVEREIEDLEALIDANGGAATLWGWSSGGALALRAAAAGIGVDRVSVYEIPFMVDPDHNRPTPDYEERIDELVAAGDKNGLVKHFMRNAIGMPAPVVAAMRLLPMWKQIRQNAESLGYDWEALGRHTMYGAPLDPQEWAAVEVPVQVVNGSKSPEVLRKGSAALAEVLPDAEHRVLEGLSHNLKMDVLTPVVAEFVRAERNQVEHSAETLVTS